MPSQFPIKYIEPRRGRRSIERRAWSLMEKCRRSVGLEAVPVPIPVEKWIEGPLRIRFGIADLSHLGPSVIGAAYVKEREIQVDESLLQAEGRYRFTCAHELGHIILHSHVDAHFLDTSVLSSQAALYERQADRFAAAFLMPVPIFEHEFLAQAKRNGLKRGEFIIKLIHPLDEAEQLWRRVLPPLAGRFDVSWSAVVHRCSDLQPRVQDSRPLLSDEIKARLLPPLPSVMPNDP